MGYRVKKSDQEWRTTLGEERYRVLRTGGTERPYIGELLGEKRPGGYQCAGCGMVLFSSSTKFDAGCGWPSFYETVNREAVELREDVTLGVVRTEVLCAGCGGHLGHVFPDGYGTPTGLRYCINSLSLTFQIGE